MNPAWVIHTGRLVLSPVAGGDLPDLRAIKADPGVFAVMLGGVRGYAQAADDLARDIIAWGRYGFGWWAIRETASRETASGRFAGVAGLEHRPDGRGVALRFALWPEAQGRGLAREAAFAVLRFGHDNAHLPRIIAVARSSNFGSRTILGAIGMREAGRFEQRGYDMILYESVSPPGSAISGCAWR
ncbi:GNAT family N-acetyltransferase [Rhodopila globiformis]|uniref:GNAT family N-acetyltransferase n=1 Tax=Rhodopila globiformis TaxID=1071 RepID=A0A2S6MXG7_RHOGL|nr:GNAT family N-acetyltransferase [Rhodopila globiformis]PPQ27063.1 GNAT family N-acetyltransferase [Rhodopila globiformis]